jgi:phosphonatase-like hydrolase
MVKWDIVILTWGESYNIFRIKSEFNRMISMIVFDMAGTTINEDNVVYKTLQRAINEKGYHFSLDQVLAQGAGKEKGEAIKSILGLNRQVPDQSLASEIYQHFIVYLASAYENLPVLPQPGSVELFRILKRRDIRIVLNTGYNTETALLLLSKLGWKKGVEFDDLITSSDVKNNRPDPEMIKRAMGNSGIQNSEEVVKVGDSIIDIEEGQNAGCGMSIGITTGAHSFQQLRSANPDHIINNLLELIPIIDKVNN